MTQSAWLGLIPEKASRGQLKSTIIASNDTRAEEKGRSRVVHPAAEEYQCEPKATRKSGSRPS